MKNLHDQKFNLFPVALRFSYFSGFSLLVPRTIGPVALVSYPVRIERRLQKITTIDKTDQMHW